MKKQIEVKPIGFVKGENYKFLIKLEEEFKSGLTNLDGFSHLQVAWWGHLTDEQSYRRNLVFQKPYKNGPEKIGVFATRSPMRPNPVLITSVYVEKIDYSNGIIYIPWIDAEEGSPVLDIKPYHLSERVRDCQVPEWCKHWPLWDEDSVEFPWQNEFNF